MIQTTQYPTQTRRFDGPAPGPMADAPVAVSPLQGRIAEMTATLDGLNEAIEGLFRKAAPLLLPDRPTPVEKVHTNGHSQSESKFAAEICEQIERVRKITCGIAELCDRLDA